MLGGRVKTLHPAIHAGILARNTPDDIEQLSQFDFSFIDFVVCNLYPFEQTVNDPNVTMDGAVEEIDIGGVTLLRAAAKNHSRVTVLSDPKDYSLVINELKTAQTISSDLKQKLALKAFTLTSNYDTAISSFFRPKYANTSHHLSLRYGANPHQLPASVFCDLGLPFKVLNGSPGYINLLDAFNSWPLVKELSAVVNLPAAASFKHVSPAGVGVGLELSEIDRQVCMVDDLELTPVASSYARARGCDRMSSFGDWIALSHPCDLSTAKIISREVSDGIIAPDYTPEAMEILSKKKGGKYCVLKVDPDFNPSPFEKRSLFGMTLCQARNNVMITPDYFNDVQTHDSKITKEQKIDLTIAAISLKYTQSNSVCYAKNGQTVGIGAGQQSRIHCTRLAGDKTDQWWLRHHPKVLSLDFKKGVKRADKSNAIDTFLLNEIEDASLFETLPEYLTMEQRQEWIKELKGVVLLSDAFFPFKDNIIRASKSGVDCIGAPKGSVNDELVVKQAQELGISYIFTQHRLFHH